MTNYAVNTNDPFADIYCVTYMRIHIYWVYIKQYFFNVTCNQSVNCHNFDSIKMHYGDDGSKWGGAERLVDIKGN